jgi:hypothetical protein
MVLQRVFHIQRSAVRRKEIHMAQDTPDVLAAAKAMADKAEDFDKSVSRFTLRDGYALQRVRSD